MTKYIPETAALDDVVMTGAELMDATTTTVRAICNDFDTDITFEGDGAYTDGSDIVLPTLPVDATVTKRDALVVGGYANHEGLHKLLTDFDRLKPKMRKWARENRPLTKALANALEDVRIETGGAILYGGMPQAIDKTARDVTRKFIDEVYPKDTSVVEDFGVVGPVAITWEGRRRIGYPDPSNAEALALLPTKMRQKIEGIVDKVMDIEHGVTGLGQINRPVAHQGSIDAAKLAEKIANSHMAQERKKQKKEDEKAKAPGKSEQANPDKPGPLGDAQDGNGKQDGSDGNSGQGDGNELDKTKPQSSDKPSTDEPDGNGPNTGDNRQGIDMPDNADTSTTSSGVGSVMGDVPEKLREPEPIELGLHKAVERAVDTIKSSSSTGYTVMFPQRDEFRTRRQIVDRYDVRGYGNVWYGQHKGSISGVIGTTRRKLERILTAMSRTSWENGKRSGKLDVRRNVDKIVNLKPNVFRRKEDETNVNTALTILIDMSSSMKSKGKIGLATKATIAIAEALDPVGVPLEVLGHFTRRPPMSNLSDEQQEREVKAMYGRRDLLIMTQFKDFDDNLSRCKSALGSIDSLYGGANADGDAILFAAKRLLERREERKMLFVLSDGQPAYRSDTRCKHQYTRDAVDWCTFRGIDVMGLGMLDQSVSQYYPKYVVINDMNDFARTYIEELVKMMQKRALPDQSLLIRSTAKRGRNI